MQILIVDDHSGFRQLIRELLGDWFHLPPAKRPSIRECDSAESAFQSALDVRPDLVTVDVRMPGMNGIECVARLRRFLPLTCIVVVTQFDGDSLLERARAAGADAVVLKSELHRLQDVAERYLPWRRGG